MFPTRLPAAHGLEPGTFRSQVEHATHWANAPPMVYVHVCFCFHQVRSDVAYANSKGIEVGGYDMIALTRSVPEYWRAIGGDGACMASDWYAVMP